MISPEDMKLEYATYINGTPDWFRSDDHSNPETYLVCASQVVTAL